MELTGKSKHLMFMNHMMAEIMDTVSEIFDAETDPEVSWHVFRTFLRKIKKEHVEAYNEYMECDVEDEPEESEIWKWRRENPDKYKPHK